MFWMKRIFKKVVLPGLVCLALLAILVPPVMAMGMGQGEQPVQKDALGMVLELVFTFGGLAGVAGLISMLVNVGKWAGVINDGTAQAWVAGLNLVVLGALVGVKLFDPSITLDFLDAQMGKIAQIGIFILGYATQIIGSNKIYPWLKQLKIPGLSYSHTGG